MTSTSLICRSETSFAEYIWLAYTSRFVSILTVFDSKLETTAKPRAKLILGGSRLWRNSFGEIGQKQTIFFSKVLLLN